MEFLDVDMEQEHVRVCRICLMMDVKLFNLQSYPLDTYFEAVIGIPLISTMDLPPYICYECVGHARKFCFFKDRCLRGQAVLYGILQATGKVSEQDIKQINRKSIGVASDLCVKDTSSYQDVSHDENTVLEIDIKQEPIIVNEDGIELSVGLDCVKEEPDFIFEDDHHSSDDEPLSVHKTIKKKKKGKKRGRKRKEEKVDFFPDLFENGGCLNGVASKTQESTLIEPVDQPTKVKKPRGSRRTKNTGGVDFEDINLEEYVTIVNLTLQEQMEEIQKRKESSNYRNAPFQCSLCYKGFIDTNAWKHHLAKHDPSAGDVICEVCKFRFPSRRALQKHVLNHEKKYACKACSYVSKTTTQAKQHQKWHKGVTYSCEYCDEVSTKWTSYLSHVRIKHPSQHICPVCGYSFVSRLGLAMHRTMMHKHEKETEAGEGPYCAECDVKFVSTEAYNRHMVTSVKHSVSNNFSLGCRVCGAKFPSPEELRLHHRKAHARPRPRNYGKRPHGAHWPAKCEHCSEEIENAREHWTHFRRAHPDKVYPIRKDYVCDICGKSFRGNAFLTYHKRTHTEERAYKCTLCDKAFHNRTNLYMHQRTHSELRPHVCAVCGKGFKCKAALDRHFRSHTGEKPYKCEVCGKSFGQSNSRKLHVRTVHLRQPAPSVRNDPNSLRL